MTAPVLRGQAAAAVKHRGSHLQIIAAAGSGKTEVVSQRVASLLADGVPADGIVAFTFTERAAAELKERIAQRVEERSGREMLDRIGGLFVAMRPVAAKEGKNVRGLIITTQPNRRREELVAKQATAMGLALEWFVLAVKAVADLRVASEAGWEVAPDAGRHR